jgi:hypothetical protein
MLASGPVDKLGREMLREGQFNIIMPVAQLADKVSEEIMKIPGVISVECVGDSTVVKAEDNLEKELEQVILKCTGLKIQMKVEEFELEEVYMKYFRES